MRNFPIKIDSKEYWISRSMATVGFIICISHNNIYILANKRGNGTPDYQGLWNCPCGYLDYHETLKECCAREIYEESNFKINPEQLVFWKYNDNPKDDSRENVTFRFYAKLKDSALCQHIYPKGFENNEVADVMWININDIDKYEWAFNHKQLIKDLLKYLKIKV